MSNPGCGYKVKEQLADPQTSKSGIGHRVWDPRPQCMKVWGTIQALGLAEGGPPKASKHQSQRV